jgi:hypothetical protein
VRSILPPAPLYLIDLLFYFEGFEVVEFGFVGLKFGVELILACFFLQNVSSFPRAVLDLQEYSSQLLHTVSFLSNRTTLPPLSPVAK